ncbi:MAG: hypothetical protein Q7J32_04350 [Sphingomonadaceae bacterium]|nr:hypothetical protein [Sphingomonadaceae bacterium]
MTTRSEDWAGSEPVIVLVKPTVERSTRVKVYSATYGPLDADVLKLFEELGWEEERTLL